jgi:DNA-binding IscR family transcriptional regulator
MKELAIELRLPVSLVEEQVQHLIEAGILGLMARPEGVSLTKPIELISVMEVLNATHKGRVADAIVLLDADDAIREVLSRRDEAVTAALEGHTLRSLIENSTARSTRKDDLGKRPVPFVHRG